jgi:hypothetical protein
MELARWLHPRGRCSHALCVAAIVATQPLSSSAQPAAGAASQDRAASGAARPGNEIDLFMERVLDNREDSWRRLGDFILRETETFAFEAPLGIPLSGFRHEYEWYVRDDVVVRSPVRFDGVDIDEGTRREYEETWLREEQRRLGRRDQRRRRMSRRDTEDNVAIAIERIWGAAVSEPLRERIASDADLIGDDLAAITLNTGAVLEDLGGVETVGFAAAVARTRDLYAMLDTERLTTTEVERAVRLPLVSLVEAIGLAETSELAGFVELAELGAHFELDGRALAPYVDRAARQLEDVGQAEVADTLDEIRGRLVMRTADVRATADPDEAGEPDAAVLLDTTRLEPRFISESYFLDFTFEPGNYYLAGRETLAGREVVRIEYYPTDLFDDGPADDPAASDRDRRIDRGFNKTTLVTLWIDPEAHQIVKYTFDNTGLDFLPGRWLLRVEGLEATMEMGQPIGDVWLPLRVTVSGRAATALGEFDVMFTRSFSDYREAETGANLIDAGDPRRPQ